jgi:succinyl-CoA synthetase beta subunit
LFIEEEATQVEINPLVQTTDGQVYCVDAKILFDDNASFRHQELHEMRDTSMEDPREVEASKFNLNYIGLDGNIGCMVNGAGLAMATMDIIQNKGGQPANFLDVGGNASEKQVEEAFRILTADPKVKALLVNIFGGIMKCDIIANGIVNAAKNIKLSVPLVVRLEGTNVEKGNQILMDSGIAIVTANNLDQAAEKAVAALRA